VEPGVRVDGVAVVDVVFDGTLDRASRKKTLDELEGALRELPGVTSVGAGQQLPLRGGGYRAGLRIDERPALQNAATEYRSVAPAVAVQQTTTMRRVLDTSVGPARQVVSLLSLLAGLALILGAVGVYGVMTHFATRRRRDWAIRVAIGLPGSRVIAHVLGHG